jgi:hypothetical protein
MMKSALLYLLATSACTLATPALAKAGAQDCAGLGAFPVMGGHVTQTRFSAAEPALAGNGKADHPARPENCVVSGTINPRQGIDGRTYGIRFELRLPTLWRGRFYYGGGGGVDGFLPAADGTYPSGDGQHSALGDGMAVAVTDSGHEIDATRANGAFLFGADPQARDEYGDQQLPLVADAAKRLIAAYYGSPARYSYFYGCSNGGRQAMVAAQRLPDLFDGIIACSPVSVWPKPRSWAGSSVPSLPPRSPHARPMAAPTSGIRSMRRPWPASAQRSWPIATISMARATVSSDTRHSAVSIRPTGPAHALTASAGTMR